MENERIIHVHLDNASRPYRNPHVMNEYTTAVNDLLQQNSFSLRTGAKGPYSLFLKIADSRLVIDVHCFAGATAQEETTAEKTRILVPISPLRTIIRDYFFICDSYYKALKQMLSSQVQTIDMARRGLHNEGSEKLKDLLEKDAKTDADTARRLFTLLCVLHMR